MKNNKIFILLFFLVIALLLMNFFKENLIITPLTTHTLNAKATVLLFGISVTADLSPPILIIDDPKSTTTYSEGSNIPLNFIISDSSSISKIYYNLDNGANITLTENITFTSTTGTHTLNLFANDTKGNLNSTSQTFTISGVSTGSASTSGAGGGGGGGKKVEEKPVYSLSIDKELIKIRIKQGETLLDNFTIINLGNTQVRINLEVVNLLKFLTLDKNQVFINPSRQELIKLIASAAESEEPEVYTGRVLLNSENIQKTVLVIIEILGKKALFDIKAELPKNQEIVEQGKTINPEIVLYNLGDLMPVDVELFYSLRDFDGRDILPVKETFAVNEQKLFRAKIDIPKDLKEGWYLVYVKLTYGNQTAVSSIPFKVVKKEKLSPWILSSVLFLILIYLYFVYRKNVNKRIRKLFK